MSRSSKNPGSNHSQRSALLAACTAHGVHDGLTDLIYVLLPIWQSQFVLAYAMVGLMRGLYSGTMAGCQLLASRLARRWGRKRLLVLGTLLAGLSYLLAGQAAGLLMLLPALALGGVGASTQHPLASSLVADTHEAGASVRKALAQYNFAGDIGKTLLPALAGLVLTVLDWRACVSLMGGLGVLAALLLWRLLPAADSAGIASPAVPKKELVAPASQGSSALRALLLTGLLDSAVRMGFLTFLPFLLRARGAGTAGIGLALSLLFVGGACGKLVCGYLAARIGMMKTVWLTELATAVVIMLSIVLPLSGIMTLLPLLGVVLNGTSSALYGTVPELAGAGGRERAFAQFYTVTIGAGALAPVLFGRLGDIMGMPVALCCLAVLLLPTLPLAWRVQQGLLVLETPTPAS